MNRRGLRRKGQGRRSCSVPARIETGVAQNRPKRTVRSGQMRLLVACCEVLYTGRLTARLPEAVRLLMFKADGSFLVHDDAGGFRPLNWMTAPCVIEESEGSIVVRKRAGKTEDRLEIRLAEILSDVKHDMGESVALQKDGVERHLLRRGRPRAAARRARARAHALLRLVGGFDEMQLCRRAALLAPMRRPRSRR